MSAREYACGICGKRGTAASMTYSRWTGNRYCRNLAACAARAKRAKRTRRKRELTTS